MNLEGINSTYFTCQRIGLWGNDGYSFECAVVASVSVLNCYYLGEIDAATKNIKIEAEPGPEYGAELEAKRKSIISNMLFQLDT